MPTAAIQHNDTAAFVYVVVKDYKPAKEEKEPEGDKGASGDKDTKDTKPSKDEKEEKSAPDPNALFAKPSRLPRRHHRDRGGDTAAVTGVKAGDQLITDGFEKLQDGSKVSVKKPGETDASKAKGRGPCKKQPPS